MLSLSVSRPALLAHARSPTAARCSLAARPAAAVARVAAGKRITRPATTTAAVAAMTKPGVECSSSSSAPSSSPAEAFILKASLAALAAAPPNLLLALASHADETAAASDAAGGGGGFKISPLELLLALAPVVFYTVLSLYRKFVNPRASISDGLFIVVALVIVANVISILVFHKRIY